MSKKNFPSHPQASVGLDITPSPALLTQRARDQLGYIADAQRAFEALERLITPLGAHDFETIDAGRTDFGHLLRILNAEMRIQIEETTNAITAVVDAISTTS